VATLGDNVGHSSRGLGHLLRIRVKDSTAIKPTPHPPMPALDVNRGSRPGHKFLAAFAVGSRRGEGGGGSGEVVASTVARRSVPFTGLVRTSWLANFREIWAAPCLGRRILEVDFPWRRVTPLR